VPVIGSPRVNVPGVEEQRRKVLKEASRTLAHESVEPALCAADHNLNNIALIPSPTGASRALLNAAVGAELLVVGFRGQGGLRGMLLGSVSRQSAHHTPCPILVVRVGSQRVPQLDTEGNERSRTKP
jgi:nucleotide-binding universal stress UspA family protein